MTPSGGIRERLSAISNIWIQNAPYYSLSVTLFCDLKRSQKSVTLPSIEGKLRLEVHSWMIDFLLYCIRGPFLPIPCHTYSESLDWSRSFDPHSDLIIGQKIGKGNAKGGGKPWVEVYSLMIDVLLYRIRGPSLPIPCHTHLESLGRSRSYGPCTDHDTCLKIGKDSARGGGVHWFEVYSWMINFLLHFIRGPSLPIPCQRLPINWHTGP